MSDKIQKLWIGNINNISSCVGIFILPLSTCHKKLGHEAPRGHRRQSIHISCVNTRACLHPMLSNKHLQHSSSIHFVQDCKSDKLLSHQKHFRHYCCHHQAYDYFDSSEKVNNTHRLCHNNQTGCSIGCWHKSGHRLAGRIAGQRLQPLNKLKTPCIGLIYPFSILLL